MFYDASRKLILRGVDGIVFVADYQQERMDANVEALDNLMDNLKEHGYDFNKIPYVLQLNKRDLPNVLSVDDFVQATTPQERTRDRSRSLPGPRSIRDAERDRTASADRSEARRVTESSDVRRQSSALPSLSVLLLEYSLRPRFEDVVRRLRV